MPRNFDVGRVCVDAALLALLIGAVAGCRSSDQPGIPLWSVSQRPTLRIGSEASEATRFGSIGFAARTATGRIVVLSSGKNAQLRVFDSTGSYLSTIGRSGDGPGEFRSPAVLFLSGDTVVVFEQPPRSRIDVFAVPGGFQSTSRVWPAHGTPTFSVVRRLSTGQYLVTEGGFRRLPPVNPGDLVRDSTRFGILTLSDSGRIDWLPKLALGWHVGYRLPPGIPGGGAAIYPFRGGNLVGASGGRIWIVDAQEAGIRIFDTALKEVVSTSLELPRHNSRQ
jgi:hypothetical protein